MANHDDLGELTREAQALVSKVGQMNREVSQKLADLERGRRSNRKLIYVVIAGFVLDILVTIAIVISGMQIKANSSEIEDVQDRTSNQVLCPLYEQFLRAEKNPAPSTYNAEQRKARMEGFKVIREGYRTLNCKPADETPHK